MAYKPTCSRQLLLSLLPSNHHQPTQLSCPHSLAKPYPLPLTTHTTSVSPWPLLAVTTSRHLFWRTFGFWGSRLLDAPTPLQELREGSLLQETLGGGHRPHANLLGVKEGGGMPRDRRHS